MKIIKYDNITAQLFFKPLFTHEIALEKICNFYDLLDDMLVFNDETDEKILNEKNFSLFKECGYIIYLKTRNKLPYIDEQIQIIVSHSYTDDNQCSIFSLDPVIGDVAIDIINQIWKFFLIIFEYACTKLVPFMGILNVIDTEREMNAITDTFPCQANDLPVFFPPAFFIKNGYLSDELFNEIKSLPAPMNKNVGNGQFITVMPTLIETPSDIIIQHIDQLNKGKFQFGLPEFK